jgi:ferric iron reductase protein FhuF
MATSTSSTHAVALLVVVSMFAGSYAGLDMLVPLFVLSLLITTFHNSL